MSYNVCMLLYGTLYGTAYEGDCILLHIYVL